MEVKDTVEVAFRTNKQSPNSQQRHDLTRRQCCKLRLVAGQQDSQALLVAKEVKNVLVAFSVIGANPSTCALSPLAPQNGDPTPNRATTSRALAPSQSAIKNL